jgi:hypothetical protein
LNRSQLVPASNISNGEVAAYAEEAARYIKGHRFCESLVSVDLAWASAGVLGVFVVRIRPAFPQAPSSLWVVVGDLPPAYMPSDEATDWRDALDAYIFIMSEWVAAVRAGAPLDDVIPVAAPATLENADLLEKRLHFIKTSILGADPETISSDT